MSGDAPAVGEGPEPGPERALGEGPRLGDERGEAPVRFRIDLGYAGGGFHGWAAQPGLRTVQGVLEDSLEKICGQRLRTVVAGRTDAGVHARRQVVHVDVPAAALPRLCGRSTRDPAQGLASRLRGVLGHLEAADVVVHGAQQVPEEFDARFAAIWRRYSYRLADAGAFRDPLATAHTVELRRELDVGAMAAAAAESLGLHDFLPFCKPRPESTTIRTLHELTVVREERGGVIALGLRADAFCHHMVRALVGGLVKVGSGSWPVTEPARLLARAAQGVSKSELPPMLLMPAHGLVLEEVGYPAHPADWARQAESARNRRDASELGTDARIADRPDSRTASRPDTGAGLGESR